MAYLIDPTSLPNPEIVLPPRAFREWCCLPEVPPGCLPQPQDYSFKGTQGLIDLSREQRVLVIQQDDIDKNPLYTQYLYQETGQYDDNEEEMEIDDQMPANARDAHMAAPTSTQHPYHHLLASYATYTQQALGLPQSIHTDTDAAMEFDTLKVIVRAAPPQGPAKELSALDLVNHLTKVMANATTEVIDRLAKPPPVTDATDAAVWERFMQRSATTAQHSSTNPSPAAAGRVSVLDQLAHRQQSPQKEDPWLTRPEMMPWKMERGHQPTGATSLVDPPAGLYKTLAGQLAKRGEVSPVLGIKLTQRKARQKKVPARAERSKPE